jgi:hypothetical protein
MPSRIDDALGTLDLGEVNALIRRSPGVAYAYPTEALFVRQDGGGEVHETETIDVSRTKGVDAATQIVAHSTGLGQRPPPVGF